MVKVTAKGTVRVPVAGLCRYRPGERSRLIHRTLTYRGRKGEPKGLPGAGADPAAGRPDRAGPGPPVAAQDSHLISIRLLVRQRGKATGLS
ncbi:hypothetical protein AB0M88_52955, partial [Actinoplanes sp. NPDC051411]